jgi:DNA-binding NarL/FixJ family response regulator
LSQILSWQAASLIAWPITLRASAQEGRNIAEAIGDRFVARVCRWCLAVGRTFEGDLPGAAAAFAELISEAGAAHDAVIEANSLGMQGFVLASQGHVGAARAAADAAVEAAAELGGVSAALGYSASAFSALAAGDAATALDASEASAPYMINFQGIAATRRVVAAHTARANGDLSTALHWADQAVSAADGHRLVLALTARAQVAIAAGEPDQAERDAHDALACGAETGAYLAVPDILECLAAVASNSGSHREAARLWGAADGVRQRMSAVRLKVDDASCAAFSARSRDAMGETNFESAWAEGAALSPEEAVAYAQRGRGKRKRPTSGWASLTPTELDVVRLVTEGLANNDIAARLFVSPRTVQTHLTHVYTKLGLASRVQLAQEATRRA